ncbi:MAG TPA: trypsin-like serine protease [Candidatus Thermoplasmatota archaeon]|nr:trypsin-like serine protease [Candidatus Thermoplasmatota archaeon]
MRLLAALLAVSLVPFAGGAPLPDDDAGSGRDAPNSPTADVVIVPGVVYEGTYSVPGDFVDYYAFPANSGDTLQVKATLPHACIRFYTPTGHARSLNCPAGGTIVTTATTANVTGTWFVALSQNGVSLLPYRFSLGVNGPAPDPIAVAVGNTASFIQPGQQVTTPSGSCTLNFAYNGTGTKAGKVYIGTAAHCFTALGQPASAAGATNFGTVVYMGDYAGINVGSFNNGIPGTQVDFALIEVAPAYHGLVKGEVKGHPGLPKLVKAHGTVVRGDVFKFSGYGTGFHATQPTREMRVGVYTTGGSTQWNAAAPIMPGDSGGPVLHADGKAVGVATHVSVNGAGGPWLDTAMAEASSAGFPTALRPAY